MGCGCGSKTADDEYVVTLLNGEQKIASNEVQARQMIARAGGGTIRKTAKANG